MEMTEREICRSYLDAKYQDDQLDILADLNLITRIEVINILTRNDIEVKQSAIHEGKRRKYTEKECDKICHLRNQGRTWDYIAGIIGINKAYNVKQFALKHLGDRIKVRGKVKYVRENEA
jgi:hypothetical protein